ncbi:MAG: hypothetical protein JSS61_05985 [Verrucomicrobia bacterium]|nr:hypothetical protein [Verrucomicrobiota bacterium]
MGKMPLLDHVKSFYPSTSLSNVLLIGCQHILASTHSMLRSLYSAGLCPKNIFLLGKCYSTNKAVWKEMQLDGIHVSPLSFDFKSYQAFDDQFCRIVAQFLEQTLSRVELSKFSKIILMDDGGQLLALSSKLLKGHNNVIAIEQTTSGYKKIQSCTLQFPVINVARCQAKLNYESPMIAEVVVKKALKRIAALECTPKEILIIGNGAIGSAIHRALKDDYRAYIYDKNMNDTHSLNEHLQRADLIIGCTGEKSLAFSKFKLLKKGCVLFSASSSDREFDAINFRKLVKLIKSCHADVQVQGITLLNCGFPINFDGGRNSVAPTKIQLTRALLMAALFQACEMSDCVSEIVPLDIEAQRDIVSKYLQLYPSFTLSSVQPAIYEKHRSISRKLPLARKGKALHRRSCQKPKNFSLTL